MGLLHMGYAAAEVAELNRRKDELVPQLREQIEKEGGRVERI